MEKIVTITLPDIGEGVVEGEVVEWLKKEGDSVSQDEPVVVVMTDKATVELPSPYPGVLAKQHRKAGETAYLGKPLYDLEVVNVPAALPSVSSVSIPPTQPPLQPHSSRPKASNRTLATPKTRGLARELGIDIGLLTPKGADGRITTEDLKQAPKSSEPVLHLPDDEVIPLIGVRKLMARKMAHSKGNIPHFSYFEELDATRLIQLRTHFKQEAAKEGIQVTYMPFLIRALSLALSKCPLVNSSLDGTTLLLHKQHNVGVAMTTEQGLIVPVLKGVQEMSLQDVVRAYDALRKKTLEGKLERDDMREGTISISNFGVLGGGGKWATPIINYPEVAILAVAKIQKRPYVKNNELIACDTLNLSWSFDHRVIDGDQAAKFSHHFAMLLENPAQLL